ncbi:MAG TPA: glutaminyl-peptide cyclotransferase [Pyrinomonadaceae bacterium]|nr:glutaminyl-peptide cyclotransferase [Chloracidobacterium sp.]MBP9934899.1 glutaminyl-peptide cyclotransferase [Pyrinomonadaceae bacterium]MBK7803327.1 glutaminyl-peptide cyclotransferase [Chloracidobacterium sp.]MBK9438577.1 glutaminyl-peptide cyclotransferase [Chloracidobacterium sp.]MBK9766625.1 glutaminyl-peptide cyclotransferase [Chloracidobacterium sp.]
MRFLFLIISVSLSLACGGAANTAKPNVNTNTNTKTVSTALPVYGYEIVKAYPHDPKAFTEGLFYYNGFLYESTGEERRSSIRKVELETGKIVQKFDLPPEDFGEGIVLLNGKIYMLTWRQGLGRVFDANDLKLLKEFSYSGEGWGMTTDGTDIFMTDSTHVMRVVDPETFKPKRMLSVMREDGKPLMQINELEYIKGEIWANVWHSEQSNILGKPNYIARIDPATGKLLGWIDLAGISPDDQPRSNDPYDPKAENTLNGIAYDAEKDRIFVTGKNWKKLYEIKITPPKQ